ncbi:hypothetical protein ACIA8O_27705 [Kitasatospora sp. NPDC051853]|uniref:hypothetical protein n=1 Tax=Kitasatospora sp. NPDC051853 TaxID=3364058 RepID=UPI0037B77933
MSFSRRSLAVATVLAAAFPAPAAFAAGHDTVTAACTADWLDSATPTLTGTTTGAAARFGLWDVTTDQKLVDRQVDATDGKLAVTTDALADGHRYEWRFWPQGGGRPTAKCGFGVDTTAPIASVESTDFPAQGANKFAGQKGVFTFRATETGSGVACYKYVLDGSLGVGGCDTTSVPAGPDGSAALTLKPKDWGTHVLRVQAVDRAGNVTQPTVYTFYAPWNPNAPKSYGDLDGDGVPDIALPDAAGNLQVISTDAATTEPTFTYPAYTAPGGTGSWADLELTHGGWADGREPVDELIARKPGSTGGYYLYRNGLSANQRSPIYDYLPDAEGLVWFRTEQLVAIGAGTRSAQDRQLLAVVEGRLWRLSPDSWGDLEATPVSAPGAWTGRQLIGPGPDAAGNLAVWAREKATGTLRAYAVPRDAAGTYDFAALADPANGTVLGSFPLDRYPTLGSVGDTDGDGASDLYAVTADRHLLLFSGVTGPEDRGLLK